MIKVQIKRAGNPEQDNQPIYRVPGMAQFLRVKVPPQVFTAKCSEPQANDSNGVGGGSGVAKPASLRTETGYKAKRRVRLLYKPKPKG
jgi:hypothetical protein